MHTIDTMETLAFSRWDSTARMELERFAKRTDIKIVDIRRQQDDLVVTFRRLKPATPVGTVDVDTANESYPFHT